MSAAVGGPTEKGRVEIVEKRLPKLRPCIWDTTVVLAVAAAAVICGVLLWNDTVGTKPLSVTVLVDGETVYRGAPEDCAGDGLWIRGHGDYVLQLRFAEKNGRSGVRAAASTCPTQECVHTGVITRAGERIVCLPARTVIRLEGGNADLVTG